VRVHPLNNLETVHAFLETDRLWAAYALADLDADLRPLAEGYGAQDERGLRALALLFNALHAGRGARCDAPLG